MHYNSSHQTRPHASKNPTALQYHFGNDKHANHNLVHRQYTVSCHQSVTIRNLGGLRPFEYAEKNPGSGLMNPI